MCAALEQVRRERGAGAALGPALGDAGSVGGGRRRSAGGAESHQRVTAQTSHSGRLAWQT